MCFEDDAFLLTFFLEVPALQALCIQNSFMLLLNT